MPSDAEVIKHLAVRIMGWHKASNSTQPHCWRGGDNRCVARADWNPLADTTLGKGQAMEVWERAREMGLHLLLYDCSETGWRASCFDPDGDGQESGGDSGPRAICMAVYKTTGGRDE